MFKLFKSRSVQRELPPFVQLETRASTFAALTLPVLGLQLRGLFCPLPRRVPGRALRVFFHDLETSFLSVSLTGKNSAGMASPSPSPASRRGTPVSFPRPSAKLVRDGSVAPGQKAVNGNRARPQAWPVRPPPPRRVSTSNVSYVPTTPSTTPASSSASPLQRQALSRPGTGQGHQRRGSKRYSLPTALQSPNPSSPFSSSLEEDNDAAGSEYDDVESSFWASQHPRSSQGEEPITEVPSEGSDEDAQDLVTEVSDLDADVRLCCSLKHLMVLRD